MDASTACQTSTFLRRPEVPGFMPGIGFVGTSTITVPSPPEVLRLLPVDEDALVVLLLERIVDVVVVVRWWNATVGGWGTNASARVNEDTTAKKQTAATATRPDNLVVILGLGATSLQNLGRKVVPWIRTTKR